MACSLNNQVAYNKDDPRFKGVNSQNNLPGTVKNGAYTVNIDDYKSIETRWIAFYGESTEMRKTKTLLT